MERLKTLRTVVALLGAVFLIELILLAVMISPAPTLLWITVGTIAIAGSYMVVLSWGLIKELMNKEKKDGK